MRIILSMILLALVACETPPIKKTMQSESKEIEARRAKVTETIVSHISSNLSEGEKYFALRQFSDLPIGSEVTLKKITSEFAAEPRTETYIALDSMGWDLHFELLFDTPKGELKKELIARYKERLPDKVEIHAGLGAISFTDLVSKEDPLKEFRKSPRTLKAVQERKIYMGMPEKALIASWGEPEKINETAVGSHLKKQYVYGNQYVYVQNGKITAWQNY